MRRIYKYDIRPSRRIEILMPEGAEFLCCHEQVEYPDASFRAWFMVDDSRETEKRRFAVVGTGEPIEGTGYKYLGTALVLENTLVWPFFDMTGGK